MGTIGFSFVNLCLTLYINNSMPLIKENASITSSSAVVSNALTKVFHAGKTNSELKRIWPKLWLNLNMCMQFPVFFSTLVGFSHLWADKKNAKHKMICYIVQPCTMQPNQSRKKSGDRALMREEHLFLAGIYPLQLWIPCCVAST